MSLRHMDEKEQTKQAVVTDVKGMLRPVLNRSLGTAHCHCGVARDWHEEALRAGLVGDDGVVHRLVHCTPSSLRPATEGLNRHEPAPLKSNSPAIWQLVLVDMVQRDIAGMQKYGTRLQAHNGRDPLVDAYQEALDLAVYLRQAIYEKSGK